MCIILQLQKVGYCNLDYMDDNDDMCQQAAMKNIYHNFYKCYIGHQKMCISDGNHPLYIIV